MELRIDGRRLWTRLMALAEIGAYDDGPTGLRGVNRLALTEAEGAGRRLVERWFREAGLEVRVDAIGNVLARRAGREASSPVMSGSHIDSVPTAGAFDGCLGVLGALEVIETLNAAGVSTRRPIEIGFFTDEEGARFGTDMLGSAVAAGRLPLEQALGLTDRDGVSVAEALDRIGYRGTLDPRLEPPFAYLECHIEQGPLLEAEGMQLGVVTGVQGISWRELTITGRSAHAGTTPMSLRRDAGLAAAKVAVLVHEMARSGRYGPEMRATVGRLELDPGRVNVIARKATCTVDLRNPDDAAMAGAEVDLDRGLDEIARELGVQIAWRQTAKTAHVAFDEGVQALIAEKMRARGIVHRRILSGAGHDAQEMAALCPTAMIFVPGLYEGISHNPREYSTEEACARGVQILCDSLVELAERG